MLSDGWWTRRKERKCDGGREGERIVAHCRSPPSLTSSLLSSFAENRLDWPWIVRFLPRTTHTRGAFFSGGWNYSYGWNYSWVKVHSCCSKSTARIIANELSIWQFIGSWKSLLNIHRNSKIDCKNNCRNNFNRQFHRNFSPFFSDDNFFKIIISTVGIILTATKECSSAQGCMIPESTKLPLASRCLPRRRRGWSARRRRASPSLAGWSRDWMSIHKWRSHSPHWGKGVGRHI